MPGPTSPVVIFVPVVAPTAPVYLPSDESIAATRLAMGKMGLSPLLSSRPKLTASQKRDAEAKANAVKWGMSK
jgi:hypothetical protein